MDATIHAIANDLYPISRYKIMRSCWIFLPEERPSFTALVQNISQQLNSQQLDDHSEDLYLKIQNS